MLDIEITGGTVVEGTGPSARAADVGMRGDHDTDTAKASDD